MSLVISILTLCLCVSGFFLFRWYIGRKTAASELLADYRAETYRLIAEIDSAADRDSLLVEERIKTLKKLLDDTDRRIAVYMRELQRSRAGEQLYTSLGRGIRAALDSRTEQELSSAKAPSPKEIVTPQAELFSAETTPKQTSPSMKAGDVQEARILPRSTATKVAPTKVAGRTRSNTEKEEEISKKISSPKETAASVKAATSQKTNESNGAGEAAAKRKPKKGKLKTQIAELSAQGLPPAKIASRLKLSLAEVDLALNLLQIPKDTPTGSRP
jgi:hypothetical protein